MFLLCWLLLAVPLQAADSQRGLLFELARDGRPASYLFGTIHISDPRVLDLPLPVREAFGQSPHFVMEAVIDPAAVMAVASRGWLTDGRTLQQVLGPALFGRLRDTLEARGMPVAAFQQMKPWMVTMLLSLPPTDGNEVLDMQLYLQATAAGKRVSGLETIDEQLAIFDELPEAEQLQLLDQTLNELEHLPKQFSDMVEAYLRGDLARLVALSDSRQLAADSELAERFMQRLLVDRNQRMAERLKPLLADGGAFVAVGALHLPGDSGLLRLLADQGYRVSVRWAGHP